MMQTSQAISPANMLAAPASTGKPADAPEAKEPFGNVLSREVAERNGNQNTSGDRETTESTAHQAATSSPETADVAGLDATDLVGPARQESDGKLFSGSDAASQFTSELLALVATINEITAGRPGEDARTAASDAAAAVDPALVAGIAAPLDRLSLQAAVPQKGSELTPASGKSEAASLAGMQHLAATLSIAPVSPDAAATAATAEAQTESVPFAAVLRDTLEVGTPATQSMQVAQAETGLQMLQTGAAAGKLTPAVGSPDWDQALGQKVVWMVAGGQQSATLTLNPPDLGPLQVVLNVSNSQASASFTAAQPEVRQALEAALPRLREMLDNAGIQLGQASVGSGSAGQQGNPSQQHLHTGSARLPGAGDGGDMLRSQSAPAPAVSTGLGLVNTYA